MSSYQATSYPPAEERFNVISHGIGFLLSIVATILLLIKAAGQEDIKYSIGVAVYGVCMMILYAASTLYHSATKPKLRNRLNIVDHASIYLKIAGTYTPFTLVTLPVFTGTWLFSAVWVFALVGIVLKLFFTGRFDRLSTAMYVFMGWMVIFAFKPLMANLAPHGLYWLIAGGIAYTVGAVFYSLDDKLDFNHGIFHVFVLAGSICHFMAVYFWV
ncbi:hemolysin III family protein [Bacteroidia bacterium]|nr:hemolysin III family protein [Bacteroidia bacterium]MDB4107220.1 hemolysin III family protein [Bacteroidia bacterium]MDC1395582.1 hemolysin III family protein [Bacteroidia bacterium]